MSDAKGILGDVLGLLPVPGDHGHPDEMVTFQIEELFEGSRVGHRRGGIVPRCRAIRHLAITQD